MSGSIVGDIPTQPFEAWMRSNTHWQARDLLTGLPHHAWSESRVAEKARGTLASLDLVAPMERMESLMRVLCLRLSLPRCPCYHVQNEHASSSHYVNTFGVRTHRIAKQTNDSRFLPEAQHAAMHDVANIRATLRKVAWIDFELYAKAQARFAAVEAAENPSQVSLGLSNQGRCDASGGRMFITAGG